MKKSFPESDFLKLISSFESISKCKSPLRREFWLNKIAPFHGMSKAETRRLYALWQLERDGKLRSMASEENGDE